MYLNRLKGMLKHKLLGPTPSGHAVDLRICISSLFSDDSDALGSEITLRKQ